MPAEPPVQSPAPLDEAYQLLAGGDGWQPIAGGTDLMVQITGEIGPPPARLLDIWRLDELRGIGLDGDQLVLGALTTYTDIRRSNLCEAPAGAGRSCRHYRRRADPEPRHDRRQHRQRLPCRRYAASPAAHRRGNRARQQAGERTVAATPSGRRTGRPRRRDDELVLRVGSRCLGPSGPVQESRHAPGTGDLEGRDGRLMARDAGVWRDVRVALGSVAATPIRATETERVLEGAAPRSETADHAAATLAAEIKPIDDVDPPPITAASSPPACCIACCARRAAGRHEPVLAQPVKRGRRYLPELWRVRGVRRALLRDLRHIPEPASPARRSESWPRSCSPTSWARPALASSSIRSDSAFSP